MSSNGTRPTGAQCAIAYLGSRGNRSPECIEETVVITMRVDCERCGQHERDLVSGVHGAEADPYEATAPIDSPDMAFLLVARVGLEPTTSAL